MHQMFAPRDLAKQALFVAGTTGVIGHSGRFLSASAKCEHTFPLSLVPFLLLYSSWGKIATTDMALKQRHNSR